MRLTEARQGVRMLKFMDGIWPLGSGGAEPVMRSTGSSVAGAIGQAAEVHLWMQLSFLPVAFPQAGLRRSWHGTSMALPGPPHGRFMDG